MFAGVGRGCATATFPADGRCPPADVIRAAFGARPAARFDQLRHWTSPTVPVVGVEPTCPYGHRGLSSARMPFRQTGMFSFGGARWCTKPPTHGLHTAALSALVPSLAFTTFPAMGVHPVQRFPWLLPTSYHAVVPRGIEPPLTDRESVVLPLHHGTMYILCYHLFLSCKA